MGERLRDRRKALKLNQEELSGRLGINNRQTLSDIETGKQAITPEQLAAAAQALGVTTGYFTDPFHAAAEAAFSFRAENIDTDVREALEEQAGRWLATMRELAGWRGEEDEYFPKESGTLRLTSKARYEHAQAAARALGKRLQLGNVPARRLESKIASELGIHVLYVDLPEGVAGAAARMTGVQAILVNRNEPAGRRMFNLAHEVFHLLTWDTMPPPDVETASAKSAKRVEVLANSFASALLMPREEVLEKWEAAAALSTVESIVTLAEYFQVSPPAAKWRLVVLGVLDEGSAPSDPELARARPTEPERTPPLRFNARFVELIHSAVEAGRLSLRKALSILGMTSVEFGELCRSYGRQLSYDI